MYISTERKTKKDLLTIRMIIKLELELLNNFDRDRFKTSFRIIVLYSYLILNKT